MRIYYSSKFQREYKELPKQVKEDAEAAEKLFRQNPFHPRLKTHQLLGRLKDFWAFSVNYRYRIIFEFANGDIIWFHSVGDHKIYR